MDDLTLVGTDPEWLRGQAARVDEWLQTHRKQKLNARKTVLASFREGVEYLGFHLVQGSDLGGLVRRLPQPVKKWRLVRAARTLSALPVDEKQLPHPLSLPLIPRNHKSALSSLNSYLGLHVHAKSYRLRKSVLLKLERRLTMPREWRVPPPRWFYDPCSPVRFKKDFRAVRIL